jgi:hypothetical protein
MWGQDLFTWFGPRGVVPIPTMQAYERTARFTLFYMLPLSDETVLALYIALLVAALFVALGLFTRVSLIALFLLLLSFHHRNVIILHSGDTLLRVSGFILMFSPAGEMFSLDYLMKKRRGLAVETPWAITCPIWTQRLLQLQIAAIYCQTFCSKLAGDTWWNGTAVYYAFRLEDFTRVPIPFLFDNLFLYKVMTWGTLALELALWTLIWVKEFRYYVLFAGITFHLGLDVTMNIPLFQYIMISSYLNFVDPIEVKRALDYLSVRFKLKTGGQVI